MVGRSSGMMGLVAAMLARAGVQVQAVKDAAKAEVALMRISPKEYFGGRGNGSRRKKVNRLHLAKKAKIRRRKAV